MKALDRVPQLRQEGGTEDIEIVPYSILDCWEAPLVATADTEVSHRSGKGNSGGELLELPGIAREKYRSRSTMPLVDYPSILLIATDFTS
jgi:hypothetical protein